MYLYSLKAGKLNREKKKRKKSITHTKNWDTTMQLKLSTQIYVKFEYKIGERIFINIACLV